MSKVDTVNKIFELNNSNRANDTAQYLTDDFVLSGPTPEPVGKQEWIGLQNAISAAFSDWKFNIVDMHEHGAAVHVTYYITGTHDGELDLSPMGLPSVPATGKSIRLPQEEAMAEFDGEKISALKVDPVPGAGVPGVLSQLGIDMPAP